MLFVIFLRKFFCVALSVCWGLFFFRAGRMRFLIGSRGSFLSFNVSEASFPTNFICLGNLSEISNVPCQQFLVSWELRFIVIGNTIALIPRSLLPLLWDCDFWRWNNRCIQKKGNLLPTFYLQKSGYWVTYELSSMKVECGVVDRIISVYDYWVAQLLGEWEIACDIEWVLNEVAEWVGW